MSTRRPLFYRRRRRGPRPIVFAAIAFLALVGVAAAVTEGSAGGPRGRAAALLATANGHPASARPRRDRAGATSHRRSRNEGRAIAHVLAYTPFVSAGTRRERVMALTFDDGPSPYTPSIVRILVRMHVPATFFVVGQQLTDFSAALRDELRHGFEVGDHTQNHAWLAHLSAAGQYAQIHAVASEEQRLGAPFPLLFRPPYGIYNHQTLATLEHLRMLMVLWSIDPGDWRRPGTGAIVANVLGNSRPGAIVIMHDGGGDRSQTVAALPAIINGLRRRHYTLVSVPQLLALDPPPHHQQLPRLSPA